MRFVFVKELIKYAKKKRNVYLITSDLGYRAFEEFVNLFPKRFINVGVSENNMIGIAAGMAARGKKVFVYSFFSKNIVFYRTVNMKPAVNCQSSYRRGGS